MDAARNTMLIKLPVNIFYWKSADCKRVDLTAKLCARKFSARRSNVFWTDDVNNAIYCVVCPVARLKQKTRHNVRRILHDKDEQCNKYGNRTNCWGDSGDSERIEKKFYQQESHLREISSVKKWGISNLHTLLKRQLDHLLWTWDTGNRESLQTIRR